MIFFSCLFFYPLAVAERILRWVKFQSHRNSGGLRWWQILFSLLLLQSSGDSLQRPTICFSPFHDVWNEKRRTNKDKLCWLLFFPHSCRHIASRCPMKQLERISGGAAEGKAELHFCVVLCCESQHDLLIEEEVYTRVQNLSHPPEEHKPAWRSASTTVSDYDFKKAHHIIFTFFTFEYQNLLASGCSGCNTKLNIKHW